MQQPTTEIVPLGPHTDRVAMYLEDALVGFAASHAHGQVTLDALVKAIRRQTEPLTSTPRRSPRRWPNRKPTWPIRVVGAVEEPQ